MSDEQLIENVRLAITVNDELSTKGEIELDENFLSETFLSPVEKSKLSITDLIDLNALKNMLTSNEIEVEREKDVLSNKNIKDTLYVNIEYDKGNYSDFLEKAKEVLLLLGEHGVCVAQVVSHTMKQFSCESDLPTTFSDYILCLKCTIPKDERYYEHWHYYTNIYFGTKESNEQLRREKEDYKTTAKIYVKPLFEVTLDTSQQVEHIIDHYPYKLIEEGLNFMRQDGKMDNIKTLEKLEPLLNEKIHEEKFHKELIKQIALLKEEKDVDASYDDDERLRHKHFFEDYKKKENDKTLFDSINQGIIEINNKNHYRSKYNITQMPAIQHAKINTILTKCDVHKILENI